MKYALSFVILLFPFAIAPPAVAANEPDCASVRALRNWEIKGHRTAFVQASERHRFKVTVTWSCLSTAHYGVHVEARGACLARGDHVVLTVQNEHGDFTESSCMISEVEKVPEELPAPRGRSSGG